MFAKALLIRFGLKLRVSKVVYFVTELYYISTFRGYFPWK